MHGSHRRPVALLAVLLTGQALANIDTAVVNVATPSIHQTLNASGAQLQLVVSAYVMAYAVLMITGARLGHLHGYRCVFSVGVGLFTAASLACGLAPDANTLMLARVVQGVGAALLVPQVLSCIQLAFSGAERTRALGWFVVALSSSAVVGQILGGVLIAMNILGSGWRPIFLINVPIGIGLLLAAQCHLASPLFERAAGSERVDLRGVCALCLALLLAIVPLILGRELGWPIWTWVCLLLSLPTLAIFVLVERDLLRRQAAPLLNLELLGRREVGWAVTARVAASATYFSMLFVIALFLQQVLQRSALFSSLALVSWVAAFGVAAPALRRARACVKRNAAWLGALLMAAAYGALTAETLLGVFDGPLLAAVLCLGGFGFGLTSTAVLDQLTAAVGAEHAADMSGIYSASSQLAGVAGVAAFGSLYLAVAPFNSTLAFATTTCTFAATSVFSAVAAYASRRDPVRRPMVRLGEATALR
jgi:MFS family permease